MSIYERMSSINLRMQAIQSHFGTMNLNSVPNLGGVGNLQGGPPCLNPPSTLTFEQILASKMGGTAGCTGPSQAPYSGSEKDFEGIVKDASSQFGVDEDLIRAVIRQESGFNPGVRSKAGAMGLMQLMPETAKDLGVANAMDARENVFGGVKYLKQLLDRYDGNTTKALAAYNAGPGNVDHYGGVPPFQETQHYVENILSMYGEYKKKS
ncbi:MAG: lytic transglycosylase domain-containing protein [Candidatus Eremiobacteraeota bacterium]|nr:lytic transglycosylase domain-containing protein [Candidatus Eremiobacteraeota bacterium]